ncbi:MAG: acyl-CoA thioesterase [Prevotellaceae bacterium]|jgi:acyl-CoA thioester hydrolase|nr:acyl-CoA thioesterase [Prevotellaceae bacterium]
MTDNVLKTEIIVDWSELDAFGHVNNLQIMKYAQTARVHFLESLGLMQQFIKDKKGPILAAINTQFLRPLFYGGRVTVETKVTGIGNTSMKIHHRIVNDKGSVVAEVEDVIVYYDFLKDSKLPITPEIREKITVSDC